MEENKLIENNNMIEMKAIPNYNNSIYYRNDGNYNFSDSDSDSDSDTDSDNENKKNKDNSKDNDNDIDLSNTNNDKESISLKYEQGSNGNGNNIIKLYNENGIQIFNPNLPIGNNIILKNGNLILGIKDDITQFIVVIIIGLSLLILWLVFIYPFYIYVHNNKLIGVLISIIYSVAQYYHIMCFITEPGIIPRHHSIYQIPFGKDSYAKIPGYNIIEQRDCQVCGLEKPFRTYHCIRCDNCVEEYDHHCGFVSNCIGKRNRKFFFFFLLYICLYASIIIITSFIQLIGLAYQASDLFIEMFSNIYISSLITIGVLVSLISYPLLKKTFILKCGLIISMIFYIVMFYLYRQSGTPMYINPFGVALIIACSQIVIIPSCILTDQIKLIGMDFTSNQLINLINYRRTINIDSDEINQSPSTTIIDEVPLIKEIPQLTLKEKIKNFKFFFLRRTPPSLLKQIYRY